MYLKIKCMIFKRWIKLLIYLQDMSKKKNNFGRNKNQEARLTLNIVFLLEGSAKELFFRCTMHYQLQIHQQGLYQSVDIFSIQPLWQTLVNYPFCSCMEAKIKQSLKTKPKTHTDLCLHESGCWPTNSLHSVTKWTRSRCRQLKIGWVLVGKLSINTITSLTMITDFTDFLMLYIKTYHIFETVIFLMKIVISFEIGQKDVLLVIDTFLQISKFLFQTQSTAVS